MKLSKTLLLTSALFLASAAPSYAAADSHDPEYLVTGGKFFGEMRYRYETVEQDGFTNDANAHTLRTNVGFKTGEYKGFQGLIEGQIVQHLGDEDFNSTTNGNTTFPIIADPDVQEVNQLWVSYSGVPDTKATIGRQKINLDNMRFVGTVNWRQNDQTYDAITLENTSFENLELFYGYVGNVNRIQGDDFATGDLDSDVHLANASYYISDWMLKLGVYGYWLDFDESAVNSSKTFGVRANGKVKLNSDWHLVYLAEAATQSDHGNNANDYDEEYFHISPSIYGHGFNFKVGYEYLGGDGSASFRTPLATGHKYNGWADVFLDTPDAGLEDFYVGASYTINGTDSIFDGVKVGAIYHDFDSDEDVTGDFGDELNLDISKTFTLPDDGQPFKKINVKLRYADYDGETAAGVDADREKFWFQVGFKF